MKWIDLAKPFLNTEGYYVIKTEYNTIILCYRCNHIKPYAMDINGHDLFVQYFEGDMMELLPFCNGVEKIIFNRNFGTDIKIYDYERLKSLILNRGK